MAKKVNPLLSGIAAYTATDAATDHDDPKREGKKYVATMAAVIGAKMHNEKVDSDERQQRWDESLSNGLLRANRVDRPVAAREERGSPLQPALDVTTSNHANSATEPFLELTEVDEASGRERVESAQAPWTCLKWWKLALSALAVTVLLGFGGAGANLVIVSGVVFLVFGLGALFKSLADIASWLLRDKDHKVQ